MKKVKKFIKSNIKTVVAFIIGLIVAGSSVAVVYAISATSITYTDTNSIGATTVQDAIDKLYNKTKLGNDTKFVEAYTYSSTSTNYCITGNESTCVATTCYKTKSAGACPAGTIIRYKVKPGEVVTFHVMYDNANTITMQAQRNTIYNTAWITALDYSGSTTYKNDKGPLTILPALESATAGWTNVNDQTYTMGTTTFQTNAYTGCSAYNTCDANTYTLASRTAKSRMITVQEANLLGCTGSSKSCPKWMNNYLKTSTSYGGTENDTSHGPNSLYNSSYWTMSAFSDSSSFAWYVYLSGYVDMYSDVNDTSRGARAVVVVDKP